MIKSVGVILAGGQGTRLGTVDKALINLNGRPLVTHVIERLSHQVDALAINANGDVSRFSVLDVPVIADRIQPPIGPLGGVLAGMEWARSFHADANWLITIACDTPFIPEQLVEKMSDASRDYDIVRAASSSGTHHLVAAWRIVLANELRAAIQDGMRKVADFTKRYRTATVSFADDPYDPFLNINRPGDLARAEALLTCRPGR